MLKSLSISNFILIDSLEIDFPEGLIIITGQTGAGKSILLGALSLLMGGKADASLISEGADTCVVEAQFDCDNSDLAALLEENDAEWDGGHLIIRRTLSRNGRSRSFLNDLPVRQELLQKVSSYLIDIHSQHQSLLLSDRAFQLNALDSYAGNLPLLSECASAWTSLRKLESELKEVEAKIADLSSQKEYNEAQFRQLDSASLREGELEELEQEQKTLANAEEIKSSLGSSLSMFNPGLDSFPSINVALKEAEKNLSRISRFIPELEDLAGRIASSRLELSDIEDEISTLDSSVILSEERLVQVEERMSLIYDLFKKHGCRTIEELVQLREKYRTLLFDSSDLESRREALTEDISAAEKRHRDICQMLSASRREASGRFASEILADLHFLELERSVFVVDVRDAAPGAFGSDEVVFMFSSTGKNPVDVAKCASGGEISRIMSCLKAMMARFANMPTMIFDEIDTGVSGSVADKMGTMICRMGADMQVFAITHLPQVAAKGAAHYVVNKKYEEASGLTSSSISRIDGDERVNEIARMLSGSEITSEAVANAISLLSR